MIHPAVRQAVEEQVGPIREVSSVGGGCISNACHVECDGQSFFLKWSDDAAGNTFEAESESLEALRAAGSGLLIPIVMAARDAGSDFGAGYILMEWIAEGPKDADFWERLGSGLASLHRAGAPAFGFDRDNYIGQIEQVNNRLDDWPAFFRENRLEFQRDRARQLGRWRTHWDEHFDRLSSHIDDLLPVSAPPSLVHGDLWAGNVIATKSGEAALIDPASHYADREVDLALSELFGGFRASFYQAYQEAWPLESGYGERRDIYNLYHLINHLNHFGQGYAGQVETILVAF
jgi:protein-ribulosamine 3-kinase